MSIDTALSALRFDLRFMENIVRWQRTPARDARTAPFPGTLGARLVASLKAGGVEQLYLHQADAISAAHRGEHVAVATPAASGKTLCYNLPVLDRLLTDPRAKALYLFPTKALAQDQLAALEDLLRRVDVGDQALSGRAGARRENGAPLRCGIYDGDTPSAQRSKIRDTARVILTNPDMLHMGILPQHPRWAAFFTALRLVVVDEMHVYRGVFGSHVANVLRRLRRICRFYGAEPQFLLASATIANPRDLAERLVEAPITLIGPDRDGAPQGERNVLFYNPPIVDPDLGIRKSHRAEAAELAGHFLEHDVQTIVFARSRQGAELLLSQIKRARPPQEANQLHGYRGGYLADERRSIEKGLREGTVRAVVATNALELGIDIGRLDAAILTGYPGTIAAARQQMGRAGRRSGSSVAVLVAGMGPLDQYIVANPRWLLSGTPEHARLNADNEILLAGHLVCAAAELPLQEGDAFGENRRIGDLLADLVDAGQLYRSGETYFWAGSSVTGAPPNGSQHRTGISDSNPAAALGLRSSGADRVVIQQTRADGKVRVIGEVDRPSVPLLVYEGAVYLHEGDTYLVEQLDLEGGVAHVRPADVDFYTLPSSDTQVEILAERGATGEPDPGPAGEREGRETAPTGAIYGWGDARVTTKPTGYRIIRRETSEVLGVGPIDLPPETLETQACWLRFPEHTIDALKAEGAWLSDPNEYGPNWPAQRQAARARDGFRCLGCGIPEAPGKQHDVHHKRPFRAFLADATLREGLPAALAWQVANRLQNLATLCSSCHRRAEASVRTRSGLGGAAALLAGVAPLFLMCDPGDLGIVAEPEDSSDSTKPPAPTITVYEQTPGGVGYAEQLYDSMPVVVQAAYDLVAACPCERGCPACVGPILEHEYTLDTKRLAQALLAAALK